MKKDKNLDRDIDLKNYHDPSGVSLKEMNFGLWLSEKRRLITKIIIILLIALSAFFFIYSSYNYVVYFLTGNSNEELADSFLSSPRNIVNELEISPLIIFRNEENYDLVAKLKNPNEKFLGKFQYCFEQAEQEVYCADGFIFPSEEKHVLALGQKLNADQTNITFRLKNIFWQRINSRQIPSWDDFFFSRLNFAIKNLNFSPINKSGLSERVGLNTLEFEVDNQTAYGYYEAPLNILLYSGSELVGVQHYLLTNFLAGEQRNINISWPGGLQAVNRTEVKPDINIIDENVYLKYQGENRN